MGGTLLGVLVTMKQYLTKVFFYPEGRETSTQGARVVGTIHMRKLSGSAT